LPIATTAIEGKKTGPARKASSVEDARILAVKSFMVNSSEEEEERKREKRNENDGQGATSPKSKVIPMWRHPQ
jgi:hypothetical protein